MSLNAQAIAVSGYGYGAQLIAVGGYGSTGVVASGSIRSMLAPWLGGASAVTVVANGSYRSMLAFWGGGAFGHEYVTPPEEGLNRTGTGWENYVAPRTRKTLKQYKKEYLELSYLEIEEEKAEVEADIKLAEQDIRFNVDLGLSDVIVKLKIAIGIARIKLQALEWVEKERLRKYKKAKQQSLDGDLVFIAAYLIDEEDD